MDWVVGIALVALLPVALFAELFLHELGHAVPVLLAGGYAHITVGNPDGRTITFDRLKITAGTDGIKKTFLYGTVDWGTVDSTRVRVLGIIGGPVVTLALVLTTGTLLLSGLNGVLYLVVQFLFVWLLGRAYYTIVPRTYSGGPYDGTISDGRRLMELLQS